MVTVLIAGGGTGGHVYPMVAVGDALVTERPDTEVVYVGTGRGIESRVLGARGDRLELLDVLPLRGRGVGGLLRGATRAATVLPRARALVRQLSPDVVFSVGGYAAGPVTLAAWSCGVPVTLMEPNAVPGFTNRLLKRFVARAYVCFPEMEAEVDPERALWTGVPLRSRFESAPYQPSGRVKVLVMGGSQGAQALNESLPHAFAALIRDGAAIDVVHQTGRDKDAAVRALYLQLGIDEHVRIQPFIEDVAKALSEADVIIERSGAGSLAELCAVGRPSILVPYPYAADDHQRHNAESLERAGAAVCVLQADAGPERLERELRRLVDDAPLRTKMAAAAAERGRPDAAQRVARDLLSLAADRASGGTQQSKRVDGAKPKGGDVTPPGVNRAATWIGEEPA